jgi:hypothetical protein
MTAHINAFLSEWTAAKRARDTKKLAPLLDAPIKATPSPKQYGPRSSSRPTRRRCGWPQST